MLRFSEDGSLAYRKVGLREPDGNGGEKPEMGRGMKIVFTIARMRIALLFALSVMLGGCVGPKIAADLLATAAPNDKPICSCSYEIVATINPKINNYEGIDQSVRESLDLALTTAKLFTPGAATKYQIKADVLVASEPAWSFGSFNGTLSIRYTVLGPSGQELLNKEIYTEAGSDKMYFSGAARHQRARAVNISKNVLQFVVLLRTSPALK
jgi:hypothetical protein